ncbi:MAG TPA: 3-oxoacid CoA-transferase subunit B [Acetobacteraceae bacterium]|nr:3-oxoacid CoA-transferase subunit B [Acetobacteraceae bacterium]
MSTETPFKPLDRDGMARRAAADIPEGWVVNLGIGIPTEVARFVPPEREVIFHSENGVIGAGPTPETVDPYLVNAGGQHITLRPGASLVHHADSFAIARGGHLDLSILGAFEVSEQGDVANFALHAHDPARQIGGAMDLAAGAKRLWIIMEHTTKHGTPRLRRQCHYPLTAKGTVRRVYTNLAVLDVTPRGFVVRDIIEGLSFEELQARTEATLLRD